MFPAAELWRVSEVAMISITVSQGQLQPRPAGWKSMATGHRHAGLSWTSPHSFAMPGFTSQGECVPGSGAGRGEAMVC